MDINFLPKKEILLFHKVQWKIFLKMFFLAILNFNEKEIEFLLNKMFVDVTIFILLQKGNYLVLEK